MPDSTNVEALCNIAEIVYGVVNGPIREVFFANQGGHRKIDVEEWWMSDLVVDLSLIPDFDGDRKARARAILEILAVELDCYEAVNLLRKQA